MCTCTVCPYSVLIRVERRREGKYEMNSKRKREGGRERERVKGEERKEEDLAKINWIGYVFVKNVNGRMREESGRGYEVRNTVLCSLNMFIMIEIRISYLQMLFSSPTQVGGNHILQLTHTHT